MFNTLSFDRVNASVNLNMRLCITAKGMLDNKYENYPPLMDAMKRINTRAYDLIEFFDGTDLTTGEGK